MQYLKALHQLALTALIGGLLVIAGCGGAKGNSTPNLTSQNNGSSTGSGSGASKNKSNAHANANSNSKSDPSAHGHSQSHCYTNAGANAWNNQFRW